jgi:hypothetical protein
MHPSVIGTHLFSCQPDAVHSKALRFLAALCKARCNFATEQPVTKARVTILPVHIDLSPLPTRHALLRDDIATEGPDAAHAVHSLSSHTPQQSSHVSPLCRGQQCRSTDGDAQHEARV